MNAPSQEFDKNVKLEQFACKKVPECTMWKGRHTNFQINQKMARSETSAKNRNTLAKWFLKCGT